jgi:hypothetical protein
MINYQVTIKANAGSVTVAVQGDLPDGEHVITGHEEGPLVSLHCERRSELGRPVMAVHDSVNRKFTGAPQVVAQRDPDS